MQQKIIHIFLLLLLSLGVASAQNAERYANNSALASGSWIKIAVPESGIYKITHDDLRRWGIANPAAARIFGYGGAMLPEDFSVSMPDDLPQISVYRGGDYLLFYAQGVVSWAYNKAQGEFEHTRNPYSFNGYYFITSDNVGSEKLISQKEITAEVADVTVDYFRDYKLHEKEERNLLQSGSVWYGEEFNSSTSSRSFSFSFPNIDASKKVSIIVDAAARNAGSMQVSGSTSGSVSFSSTINHQYATKGSNNKFVFTPGSSTININLRYASGTAWLDFIRVNAARKLILNGNPLFFRNPDIENQTVEYQISGQNGYVFWDITDPVNIREIPSSFDGNQYKMKDNSDILKEYVALQPAAAYPVPTFVGAVANQNLHSIGQVDYVIITHPDFWQQAENIARKHEETQGISTLIVTPEEVYNEFSSGTPDATAYRRLMKMFFDSAESDSDKKPKYLLLLGDGTYDNRGIVKETKEFNKLLTYQSKESLDDVYSYVSDDYFGLLGDKTGKNFVNDTLDIGTGRLPVSSQAQANAMVDKISHYLDDNDKGYWKNNLCYIADDDNNNESSLHIKQAHELVQMIETDYPAFQPTRIFLDSYQQIVDASGEQYPLAREKVFSMLNSGVLLINFTGHGSPNGLTNEQIITKSDAQTLHNKRLPIFFTATCGFSRFDGVIPSAGEEWLLKANAGVIGLFTTTRTVLSYENSALNKKFNDYAFNNRKILTLGEIMRLTKNNLQGASSRRNQLSFTLLADPALVIPIPTNKIEITEITSNSALRDTLQALSTATIKGEVRTPDNQPISNFNGTLHLVLYDKQKSITTFGSNSGKKYTYTDRPDILLKASCPVIDGKFSYTTLIPKDISYNYGMGRLNLYAYDVNNNMEANGYSENFRVGGTNSDFVFEDRGPDINLYLNSERFRSGDELTPDVLVIADLFDESGINASGAGIGHDLLLTLNNDPQSSFVLNDYYQTAHGDYRSGTITYKLPTLENGNYTLSLRAWDLLNNSSTKAVNFRVSNEAKPSLFECFVMPNPVSSAGENVRFRVVHNQPQTRLTIRIDVYDLSGRHLWADENPYYAEGNESVIDWNWMAEHHPLPGVYLYRVAVATEQTGIYTVKTNKLIVK